MPLQRQGVLRKNTMGDCKRIYIETYGCQMNFADSEIVGAILLKNNHQITNDLADADVVLINTCAIRDNAEQRIHKRLGELRAVKKRKPALKIGILGCMAERLKEQLLGDDIPVDLVVGPDAYRNLPELLNRVDCGERTASVLLSEEETYAEIDPVRLGSNGISAFISIMRGCQNFCSYCVVPYTRGRERSRDPQTIVDEAQRLFDKGYREITLLGQNVNSYRWDCDGQLTDFPDLMHRVAQISPLLRIRFSTSHPKDLSDKLLEVMAANPNICRCIHLPVQSGSDNMLKLMNRKYTVEWYLGRVEAIRRYLPDCSITTDVIAGFCNETEQDHQQTLELFKKVGYDYAFMFKYSMRPNTYAAKRLQDNIPEDVKTRRLEEIIALQGELSLQSNRRDVGKTFEVLIEGNSKRSAEQLFGRNSQNKVIVFPREDYQPGQYAMVEVTDCTSATLIGKAVSSQ
ncbi:MAG: tRNA (N6-isopentenyl adenosine(37)-C2)-methylthiotransferase MiaB [Bacteroidales bacterium]|nr:tRNA (N6-isopentenyl adenosine(37)-C2)-methylthiotransferase MiaB [Bacteroidales bacterium]